MALAHFPGCPDNGINERRGNDRFQRFDSRRHAQRCGSGQGFPRAFGTPSLGLSWAGMGSCVPDHQGRLSGGGGLIFQLDLDRPQHRVILKRYQDGIADDVPIAAVVKPGQEELYADLLRGVQVWSEEPTVAELDGFAALVEASDELRDAG